MINSFFPLFNIVDIFLHKFLPSFMVISIWGIISGVFVMSLYALVSPQKRICKKKEEIKSLQKRLKDSDQSFDSTLKLTGENLKKSLELLGLVLLPSLLSSLPALVMILWVSTFYSFEYKEKEDLIQVEVEPHAEVIEIVPVKDVISREGNKYIIKITDGSQIQFLENGREIYTGIPLSPPVSSVGKKDWLNIFLEGEAGYLSPDSEVDEIRFNFKRRLIFNNAPGWMSTWEFVYFAALFLAALIIKIVFKIQ